MRDVSNLIIFSTAVLVLSSAAVAAGPPSAPLTKCPIDSVVSGSGCMDKYEASVWRVPDATTTNRGLVAKIRQGKATIADLTARGANQLGTTADDYAPCADSGQNCTDDIFALSLPGVLPSGFVTWFQAQEACANAGKRLPSNAEWQAAVAGTPDPGPDDGMTACNTIATMSATPTGSRSKCVSSVGAFDMVGNMFEWVADMVPRSTGLGTWNAEVSPTGDLQFLAGASTVGEPGPLVRGGLFVSGMNAGPLEVDGAIRAGFVLNGIGFRCAR